MLDNNSFYVKVKVLIWNKLCWESTQALTCDVKAGKPFLSSPTMIVPFLFYGFFFCFVALLLLFYKKKKKPLATTFIAYFSSSAQWILTQFS